MFILRLWCEPREIEDAKPVWRVSVEAVSTGRRRYVHELSDVPAVIASCLDEAPPADSARDPQGGDPGWDEE